MDSQPSAKTRKTPPNEDFPPDPTEGAFPSQGKGKTKSKVKRPPPSSKGKEGPLAKGTISSMRDSLKF